MTTRLPPPRSAHLSVVAALLLAAPMFAAPPAGAAAGELPDLVVTHVAMSPSPVSFGGTATFTATVQNVGTAATGSFRLGFSMQDIGTTDALVASLAPGESVDVARSMATTGLYSWTMTARPDYVGSVEESDETNNDFAFGFTQPPIDLHFTSLTSAPGEPGETVYTAVIRNQGTGHAGPFHVDVRRGFTHAAGHNVPSLAPGASVSVVQSFPSPTDDSAFRARVDATEVVPESDESNNVATLAPAPAMPELVVESIAMDPAVAPSFTFFAAFTAMVRNQGTGASPTSVVRFVPQGQPTVDVPVPALAPGAAFVATSSLILTAPSLSWTLRAIADATGVVAEVDETNNERAFEFTHLATDIVILDLAMDPPAPAPGTPVTFRATVRNEGPGHVGRVVTTFTFAGGEIRSADVDTMSAGDTHVFSVAMTTPASGSWTLTALAESLRIWPETSEANNEAAIVHSPSAPRPDLVVTRLSVAPSPLIAGDLAVLSVTVTNVGAASSAPSTLRLGIVGGAMADVGVEPLAPGGATTVHVPWTSVAGDWTLSALADSGATVAESNESNNAASLAFRVIAAPATCPAGHGYWKNHEELWPVETLTLGGRSFTKARLLEVLARPAHGDARIILAYQLIAAKLDLAAGTPDSPVDGTLASALVAQADDALDDNGGSLFASGDKVRTSTPAGKEMTRLAGLLGHYVGGTATPGCA